MTSHWGLWSWWSGRGHIPNDMKHVDETQLNNTYNNTTEKQTCKNVIKVITFFKLTKVTASLPLCSCWPISNSDLFLTSGPLLPVWINCRGTEHTSVCVSEWGGCVIRYTYLMRWNEMLVMPRSGVTHTHTHTNIQMWMSFKYISIQVEMCM